MFVYAILDKDNIIRGIKVTCIEEPKNSSLVLTMRYDEKVYNGIDEIYTSYNMINKIKYQDGVFIPLKEIPKEE